MALVNTFYLPLVGTNYENGFRGKKLLILGESHYCGEQCSNCGINSGKDCYSFTNDVMKLFIKYKAGNYQHEGWMNTFTRFTNVLHGKAISKDELTSFWDSVIFYNYVQSSSAGPRISPTSEQFKSSESSFFDVLTKYKPDLIIVWRKRLWDNMPSNGTEGNKVLDGKYGSFYLYEVQEKSIPAFKVYHPSTSYFNYDFTKYFDEMMTLI